jgi:hypothetical protein
MKVAGVAKVFCILLRVSLTQLTLWIAKAEAGVAVADDLAIGAAETAEGDGDGDVAHQDVALIRLIILQRIGVNYLLKSMTGSVRILKSMTGSVRIFISKVNRAEASRQCSRILVDTTGTPSKRTLNTQAGNSFGERLSPAKKVKLSGE